MGIIWWFILWKGILIFDLCVHRKLFPVPGMSMEILDRKAREHRSTHGAADVLRALRVHMRKWVYVLNHSLSLPYRVQDSASPLQVCVACKAESRNISYSMRWKFHVKQTDIDSFILVTRSNYELCLIRHVSRYSMHSNGPPGVHDPALSVQHVQAPASDSLIGCAVNGHSDLC